MGGSGVIVNLGGGRGVLRENAAKSLARIDRALGHRMQITEALRSWSQQNAHYQTYLKYGYPIALSPNTPSIHQLGYAIDSDEAQQYLSLMEAHGWRRTVYRWVNGVWTLVERWHFEYTEALDKHRHEVVTLVQSSNGAWSLPDPTTGTPSFLPPLPEGKTMADVKQIHCTTDNKKTGPIRDRAFLIPGTAWAVPFTESTATTANAGGEQFETGDSVWYSQSMFQAFIRAAERCAPTVLTISTIDANG